MPPLLDQFGRNGNENLLVELTFQDLGDLPLKVLELEGGQEPERAQVEGHDRRHRLLEERGRVEERAVAAEANDEVDLVRQVVLLLVERHQLVAHLKEDNIFLNIFLNNYLSLILAWSTLLQEVMAFVFNLLI